MKPLNSKDAAGNALVVWSQFDRTRYVIRANQYIPGAGWGKEYDIGSNKPGDVVEPKLVMDSSGNATAVWLKYDGWAYSAVGNKFCSTMDWDGPDPIELNKAEGSNHVQIGMGK